MGHHAWARVDSGEVLRAYAWTGQVVWNQGPPSPAELGLGLHCFEYLETGETGWGQTHDPILQNLDRLPLPGSAAVPGCEFEHRPGACSFRFPNIHRRGRLRYNRRGN